MFSMLFGAYFGMILQFLTLLDDFCLGVLI